MDEPNKEFEIKVTFSNVEQAIMGEFKKQIDGVAAAINVLAETMTGQIDALKLIQKEMHDFNAAVAGGLGGGGGGGAPPAQIAGGHPTGPGGASVMDLLTELQAMRGDMARAAGGGYGYSRSGSLFGRLGNMPGERNWDQENSFENPQIGNFTFQDVLRQGTSYMRNRKMGARTTADIESAHQKRNVARAAYMESEDYDGTLPDHLKNDNDFIKDATATSRGPFAGVRGRVSGMSNYMQSLGFPTSNVGDFLDKSQAISPYFSHGGVFNPGTYGLGLNDMRQHAATVGNINRFGMQFGGDARFNPLGDSGHQFIGAQWQAAKNSWFGLNPFLSGKQSQEIISSVAGMGYSHGTAEQMRHMMSDVTQHTNIGIQDQAEIMDKSFRWGYANLQQLADFMKNDIPAAAQAARMNVGQFSQQLVQVATGLSQQTGVDFFTSAGQVNNMVTGTGMLPGQAQSMLGNTSLQWLGASMAAGESGKGISIGGYYFDKNRGTNNLKAAAVRVRQLLLATPEEIGKIMQLPKDDPRRTALESRFVMAHSQLAQLGITNLNDIGRLTGVGIKHTAIVTAANEFTDGASAAGDAAVEKAGNALSEIGDDDLRSQMEGKIRADAISKYGTEQGRGGKAGLVKSVHALASNEHWSKDDINKVLGTHKGVVGHAGSHVLMGDIAGDPNRSQAQIAAALAKMIGKHAAKDNDANSKNLQRVNITLNAGPALQGLITATIGSGNNAYNQAGGTQPAPPASPNASLGNVTIP